MIETCAYYRRKLPRLLLQSNQWAAVLRQQHQTFDSRFAELFRRVNQLGTMMR